MTRDDALALLPEGWVVLDQHHIDSYHWHQVQFACLEPDGDVSIGKATIQGAQKEWQIDPEVGTSLTRSDLAKLVEMMEGDNG